MATSTKYPDKFNGMGFHTWQTKVKGHLMRKNLWSIVKVQEAESSVNTRASSTANQARDEQALGIIITALEDNSIHYIDECDTASKAWDVLERIFGAKAKHSKISLKMQLCDLSKEPNESIAAVINKLKSLMTQLAYVQAPVLEEDAVANFLKAMASEYEQSEDFEGEGTNSFT